MTGRRLHRTIDFPSQYPQRVSQELILERVPLRIQ
jgi:hypothetical protein